MTENNIPVAEPVKPSEPQHHTEPTSGRALATIILGVMSLICTGFLTGIPAIIIGNMELRDIKAGKSGRQNEGITKLGFILGIIGTALTCIVTVITFIFIMLAVSFGSFEAIRSQVGSV